MLLCVILQCETPTKFTTEPRPRRVGPKWRGRARESGSRFVDMDDQWTFQCQFQNPPPPSRQNVDRRNDPQPRPTSAASRTKPRACIWTSMFPALWSVRHVCQCQTYDYESQCATGFVRVTSVSLACGITNKSRRFNLTHIMRKHAADHECNKIECNEILLNASKCSRMQQNAVVKKRTQKC